MTDVKAKDHTRLSSEMIARMETDPEYKRKILMEHREFTRQKVAEMNEAMKSLESLTKNRAYSKSTLKFYTELGKKLSKMKKEVKKKKKEKSMKCSNVELIRKFITITSLPFDFDMDRLNATLFLNDYNWEKSILHYNYDINKNQYMSLNGNLLSFILNRELSVEEYIELDNILWNITSLYLHKI